MKTYYASPERTDQLTILQEAGMIESSELLTKTLDSLNHVVAILDPNRQAVFINKALQTTLGLDTREYALGNRPGEILKCIYSSNMEAGCGTSKECSYCGAAQSIVESQKTSTVVTKECRITADVNDTLISFDLSITSSPLNINEENYTLFIATDISDEKRRHAMERIFFHDVINKAGSLDGLIGILKETEDVTEIKSTIETLHSVSTQLVEEILSQRDLLSAEKGEIFVKYELTDPLILIYEVAAQMRIHQVAEKRNIETIVACNPSPVLTDKVLLNRVLTNMIKNALEATAEGGKVTIFLIENLNHLSFSVHNDSVMTPEIKAQVFQRSFSTKGVDRGLGTYSMKLLGEKYLKGQVSFTSDEIEGTQFFIEIPKKTSH
jgi:K+-sensing histidine kinase KdpD